VINGYYGDWTATDLPPASIPYAQLTHLTYAFALMGSDFVPAFQTPSTLQQVVQLAHSHNVKVLLSIGGWTGSQYFSTMAASSSNRRTFTSACQQLVKQYNLDGIDIDWEYPGRPGNAGNAESPDDAANFLTLLQEMRQTLGPNVELTAATSLVPFYGSDGQPMTDVSSYLPYLDRVNIMAYDVNVGTGHTGSNAPLAGEQSVHSAIQSWTNAKWPASRITMGLAFYGRVAQVTASPDECGNPASGIPISGAQPQGSSPGNPGVYLWRDMRKQGILTEPTAAADGWRRGVDSQSSTPWIYNPDTSLFVSYDDPESIALKVNAVGCAGVGGVMAWDLHQDNGELLNAVHGAMAGGYGSHVASCTTT